MQNNITKFTNTLSTIFLICLLLLAFQSIFGQVIFGFDLSKFEFGKYILDILNNLQYSLVVLAIAIGSLIFYVNREKIESIEEEQKKEELEEEKRKKEFSKKFPTIAKIPVINWIVKWMYKEGWFYSIVLLFVTLSFLGFGIHHLGQFMSVDEPKWIYHRIPQLYNSLFNLDWGGTYINDKPGILPSLLSGIVNFFLNLDYYKTHPLIFENYLFLLRLPIVLFNFIMLFVIYIFAKKLYNKNIAILITGLIALNPKLLGISQIVNPDATLWSISILTIISYFIYLKYNIKKYFYISGVFFGLALISKFFIGILYLIFFIIIYLEYLLKITNKGQFFLRLLDLLKLFGISIITYTILFPYTWIHNSQIIIGTIGGDILLKGLKYFIFVFILIFIDLLFLNGKFSNKIRTKFNLGNIFIILFTSSLLLIFIYLNINVLKNNILFDFNNYFNNLTERGVVNFIPDSISSFYFTLYSLTLPLVFFFFLSLFIYIVNIKSYSKYDKLLLLSLLILYFSFILGGSFAGFIAGARYQIMLYPIIIVFITILLKNYINYRLFLILLLIISFYEIYNSSPFYFQYNNKLNINNYLINESWGFGGYEVAQYMNKLPNAKNIKVWIDREGFNCFFIGKSYWRGKDNPFKKKFDIDYLILTSGGEKIFNKALKRWNNGARYLYAFEAANTPILKYYKKKPLFIKYIGNKSNWIKIVKIEKKDLIY